MGLTEVVDESYLEYRIKSTQYFGQKLIDLARGLLTISG